MMSDAAEKGNAALSAAQDAAGTLEDTIEDAIVQRPLAAMGLANWYVAFHFTTDTWVNFKVWGGIGLFLLFAVAQALALARYLPERS